MANKYLGIDGTGNVTEVEGTVTSAGAGDAGEIVALDAAGKLDTSVMPVGIGADVSVLPSSESLTAGDWVNIWDDAGTLKVRKADAAGGVAKRADGFVLANVTSPADATVYHEGKNTSATATIGVMHYLSATPGAETTTAPTTATHILQTLGKGITTTAIASEISEPIIRA